MDHREIWPNPWSRIEWLRLNPRDGVVLKPDAFGKRCGQSRSWLGVLKSRTLKYGTYPVDVGVAMKVAAFTGSYVEWIVDGGEDPFERYPERAKAIESYSGRITPRVLRLILSMTFHAGVRPTVERWRGMIADALIAEAKGEELGVPLDAPRDNPPENDR